MTNRIEIGYREPGESHYDRLEVYTGTMQDALAHAAKAINAASTGVIHSAGHKATVVSTRLCRIADLREVRKMSKLIKASEIGSYLEQSPEQYQAVLRAAAKWVVCEAVRFSTGLDEPLVQAQAMLLQWGEVLPSDTPSADLAAQLEFTVNGLESDYISGKLPLPIAVWYQAQLKSEG